MICELPFVVLIEQCLYMYCQKSIVIGPFIPLILLCVLCIVYCRSDEKLEAVQMATTETAQDDVKPLACEAGFNARPRTHGTYFYGFFPSMYRVSASPIQPLARDERIHLHK